MRVNLILLSVLINFGVRMVASIAIPVPHRSSKTTLCPHGAHYIDSCLNSCSCDPRYGGAMCSRMIDCDELKGTCPFGKTYTDPLWGINFECKCNDDKSQTYECFDLSQQKDINL